MRTHIDCHVRGDERTMTIMLRGTDHDFVDLIDAGEGASGDLGNLIAEIAQASGLVHSSTSDQKQAARLLRRAAEILDRDA